MEKVIFYHIRQQDEQRTGRAFRFIEESKQWTKSLLQNLEARYSIIPLYSLSDLVEYLSKNTKSIRSQLKEVSQRIVVYIDCDEAHSKGTWSNADRWKLLELCDEHQLICIEDIVYMHRYPEQQEAKTLWELAGYFPNVTVIHIGHVKQAMLKDEVEGRKTRKEWVLMNHVPDELLKLCPQMHEDQAELERLKQQLKSCTKLEVKHTDRDAEYEQIAARLIALSGNMKNQVRINKTKRYKEESELKMELPSGLQAAALIKAIQLGQPSLAVLEQSLFRLENEQDNVLIIMLQQLKQEQLERFVAELDAVISQFTARS